MPYSWRVKESCHSQERTSAKAADDQPHIPHAVETLLGVLGSVKKEGVQEDVLGSFTVAVHGDAEVLLSWSLLLSNVFE